MITSMAFVSVQDIDEAIMLLGDDLPEELQIFLVWFEDKYVGRRNMYKVHILVYKEIYKWHFIFICYGFNIYHPDYISFLIAICLSTRQ